MSTRLRMFGIIVCCLAAGACRHHQKIAPAVAPVAATNTSPAVQVASPATEFRTPEGPATTATTSTNLEDAFFNFNSSSLTPDARQNLSESATWIEKHPASDILVEGHCDERGTEQYNLALGERRAQEAKEYLGVLGVNTRNIKTISYGKDRPFATGHDETAWSQNRRAHLVVTAE